MTRPRKSQTKHDAKVLSIARKLERQGFDVKADIKREGYKPSSTDKLYSLSEIIRGFKTFSSKQINKIIAISS